MSNYVALKCLKCGNSFEVPKFRLKKNPKYCSTKCKYKDKLNGINVTCKQCGKEFIGRRNRVLKGWDKYCSGGCAKEAKKKRVTAKCINCDKYFEIQKYLGAKRKFCSSDCRDKYRVDKVSFECIVCGVEKSIKRSEFNKSKGVHTCSKRCLAEYQRSDNPDINKRTNFLYRHWRLGCLERDKYKCVRCATGRSSCVLHVHHIKPFKDFPEYRYDISNGVTLCWDCHKKEHKYNCNV